MGCGQSKLEDLEAVALCRRRTQLLAEAIDHRFALANAHADYSDSLRSVGALLQTFLEYSSSFQAPSSPVLNLPSQRKGDPLPPPTPSPPPAHQHHHLHSRSHSGSHIHFHSDSEHDSDSDADGDSPIHHHLHHLRPEPNDEFPEWPTTKTTIHYARNRPASSTVSYEQRPIGPEQVQHYYAAGPGNPSSSSDPPPPSYSSYYPPPPYSSAQNQGYYPAYPFSYGYGNMGNFFGSASPPPAMASPPRMVPESSKPPPPMPSPPRNSTWDFLNPFDYNSDNFYQRAYTPSRSSKEVREEEGIPELEDEEDEEVVVKEAYGDPKFVASSSVAAPPEELSGKGLSRDSDIGEDLQQQKRKSTGGRSSSAAELDGDVVDKNVVADDAQRPVEERSAVAHKTYRDTAEVAKEIKLQFERASDIARELGKMLEVGKQPYHQRGSVYQASKMICMLPPYTEKDVDFLDYEEDKVMGAGNISSTLQKVYVWESKLYEEVKFEEKMRVLHERQCKRLKHLDERGAEANKLDATQAMIRKLSTKIRIAIQIVESISKKIDKLRDGELWPQINELIDGFMKMWKAMLECYQTQCRAISEARSLDLISTASKLSDNHMDVTMRLELELLQWISSFAAWVAAQKKFVKSLNGWLELCLQNEPVETDDGFAPFSPGRIGAPPIFVICNYWSQIVERISEREVLDAMRSLENNVRNLWEHNSLEQRQRLVANKDIDGLLRTREREAQQIQKKVESVNKKLILVSGQKDVPFIHQSHSDQSSSLQVSLKQIFEAMESFASSIVKAYEELHSRAEEIATK